MPRRCRPSVLIAAAAIALTLAPAAARGEDRAEARQHFQAGKRHHDAGAWDAALDEYLRAYQLDPSPAFLFNIAQVYRLKGERAKALEYYRRYLEAVPQGKGSDEARAFAAELQAALDADARQQAEAARAAEEAERAEQKRLADERQAAEAARVAAAAEARHRSERRLRIAGIAAAAAGVVGLGLGVKFGLDARARADEVSNPNLTQWTAELDAAVDDGKSKNQAMVISVAIGGALVVAGGILVYLGRPAGEIKVAPVVGPGGGGAVIGWGF